MSDSPIAGQGAPDSILAHLYRWHGSAERPGALLRLLAEQVPNDGARFWRLIVEAWPAFDAIPHGRYAAAFRRHRAAWVPSIMSSDDLAAYNALPPIIDLFRGQDASAPIGLSWTTSRAVAEGFATGHRGIKNPSPAVISIKARKSRVCLVCTDRQESEIVLFACPRVGGWQRVA